MKKKFCKHEFEIFKRSNVIQLHELGYVLRLFTVKCKKCGATDYEWYNVPKDELKELETEESVLLEWK